MNRRASLHANHGHALGMKWGAAKVAPSSTAGEPKARKAEGAAYPASNAFSLADVKVRMKRFQAEAQSSRSESESESEEPSDDSIIVAKRRFDADSGESSGSSPSSSSSSDKVSPGGQRPQEATPERRRDKAAAKFASRGKAEGKGDDGRRARLKVNFEADRNGPEDGGKRGSAAQSLHTMVRKHSAAADHANDKPYHRGRARVVSEVARKSDERHEAADDHASPRRAKQKRYELGGSHNFGTIPHAEEGGLAGPYGKDPKFNHTVGAVIGETNPGGRLASVQMPGRAASDLQQEIQQRQSNVIIDHLNAQVGALILNSNMIANFHEDSKDLPRDNAEGKSSIGTISSADERDMELLFSGDHTYQFQAVQMIKKLTLDSHAKRDAAEKALKRQNSLWQRCKDCLGCKDKAKRAQLTAGIRETVAHLSNPASIFRGVSGVVGDGVAQSRPTKASGTSGAPSGGGSSKRGSCEDIATAGASSADQQLKQTGRSPSSTMSQFAASRADRASSDKKERDRDHSEPLAGGRGSLWARAKARGPINETQARSPKLNLRASSINGMSKPGMNTSSISHGDKGQPRENMLVLGEAAEGRGLSGMFAEENADPHPGFAKQEGEAEEEINQEMLACQPRDNGDGEDLLMQELEDTFEEITTPRSRCSERMERFMIDPVNRRLKNFHLLVSLTLYVDFWVTSWILGNYRFQQGKEPKDFLDHDKVYTIIMVIQVFDIFLNFFKIQIVDVRRVKEPWAVAKHYIMGQFVSDLIAVLPWSVISPSYIFLRYLKLRKFAVYQGYFDEFVQQLASSYLNNEQIGKLIGAFRLVIQIAFVSHFLANVWVLLGQIEKEEHQDGWIVGLIAKRIQLDDFFSLYITSLYWVITSFSSVGYGDVVGLTELENFFQMLVEMAGIGFFGYMVGTFQSLIQGFKEKNQNNEQKEFVNLWLIQLDKARKSVILSRSIFGGVRDFYGQKFRYDVSIVQDCIFFEQLKPRLQRQVLDSSFKNFYQTFKHIFEDCEIEFQRKIFSSAQFRFYTKDCQDEELYPEWMTDIEIPVIEQSGRISKNVYFVLSGQIHIMNKNGMYEYGLVQECGYFGDISILLNQPSEYAYFNNPHTDTALLALDAKQFLAICNDHPIARDILIERAYKRREMFENYKTVILLKYMRAIKKNPLIAQQKELQQNKEKPTLLDRARPAGLRFGSGAVDSTELKIELFSAFVKQYELTRWLRKLQRAEQAQNDPSQPGGALARSLSRMDMKQDNDSNDSNEMNEESNANKQQWTRKKALKFKLELIEAKKKAIEIDKWIENNQRAQEQKNKEAREQKEAEEVATPKNKESGQGDLGKEEATVKSPTKATGPDATKLPLQPKSAPMVVPPEEQLLPPTCPPISSQNAGVVASSGSAGGGSVAGRSRSSSPTPKIDNQSLNSKPQYESERDQVLIAQPNGAPDDQDQNEGGADENQLSFEEGRQSSLSMRAQMQDTSMQLPHDLTDQDSADLNERQQPLGPIMEENSPREDALETQRSNFDTARQLLHEEHQIESFLQREGGEQSESNKSLQQKSKPPLNRLKQKLQKGAPDTPGLIELTNLAEEGEQQAAALNLVEVEVKGDSTTKSSAGAPKPAQSLLDLLAPNKDNKKKHHYGHHEGLNNSTSTTNLDQNHNYRLCNQEQIEASIAENKLLVEKLLRSYFVMRQQDASSELRGQAPDHDSKGEGKKNMHKNSGSKKKKFVAKAENLTEMDTIIEEYINLNYINNHMHMFKCTKKNNQGSAGDSSGLSPFLTEAPAQQQNPQEAEGATSTTVKQKAVQALMSNKLDLGVSQGLIKATLSQGVLNEMHNQSPEIKKANQKIQAQTEKFRQCKATHLKGITNEIQIFNDNFIASVKQIEDKLSEKVMAKLDKMCHRFEHLPEAQQEYFIEKLQEKALRERLAKMEQEAAEKAAMQAAAGPGGKEAAR